jgi:aspartate kinase
MTAQRKMRVGGILVSRNLGMVSILNTSHGPGRAGVVLEALGEAEINVEFISCCPDSGGGDNIVVCVDQDRLQDALAAVEGVQDRLGSGSLSTTNGLIAVAVYGPHFREIPTVAGRIFRALADAGVNILAISTSISSVTSVFDQGMLEAALTSLRRHFEVG